MQIIPPGSGYWHTPPPGLPFVSVLHLGDGNHEIALRPGADVADLAGALEEIPADAVFVESFGDVDALLIFRAEPPDTSVNDSATGPKRPDVPQCVGCDAR